MRAGEKVSGHGSVDRMARLLSVYVYGMCAILCEMMRVHTKAVTRLWLVLIQ